MTMTSKFRKNLEQSLLGLKMRICHWQARRRIEKLTDNPELFQRKLLKKIIRNNEKTAFGIQNNFSSCRNYEDYKAVVGVNHYESLRPYIERQENSGFPALTAEPPAAYAMTSGTTDKPKLIPVTTSGIKRYRFSQHVSAMHIYRNYPEAYSGKILGIGSPASEGITPSGLSYGSMSGLIYNSMPGLMRRKYVLDPSIFDIKDYEEKYLKIAELSLLQKDITMIATANPSTLLRLIKTINDNLSVLLEVVDTLNPERAAEIRSLEQQHGELSYSVLWPNIKVLVIWTGGNCSVALETLRKQLDSKTQIIELGYLSSEFRGTINIDTKNNQQLPTLHENFFEFVEKDDWENDRLQFKLLHEIECEKLYYIFVTTQDGLYRYHINDIIKVTGFFRKTPTVEFVQKGKGVINLTGEKLYESQLVQAIAEQSKTAKIDIPFFILLGCPDSNQYSLYYEGQDINLSELERRICNLNCEYLEKRKSGRLSPLQGNRLIPGTGESYIKHYIEKGQREGQFKMNYLQLVSENQFDFNSFLQESHDEAA